MKSLKQFQENSDRINYSFIFNNCTQWFTEVLGGKPKSVDEIKEFLNNEIYNLYMGIFETKNTITASPEDRFLLQGNITLFSKKEQETRIILDKTFKKLGFEATPLNSFVCYTSKEDAMVDGGKPYLVFPLDGYKYAYSPFVGDILFFVKDMLKKLEYDDSHDRVTLDEREFQEKLQYRNSGLGKYVKLRKEFQVFLHGSVYLVKMIK
jgi:hypothetical protein